MPKNSIQLASPHARHLREGRWSEQYACYAVAKCTIRREPLLANPKPTEIILSSFDYMRQSNQIRLMAFCIMPDHYHSLLFLIGGKSLTEVFRSIGSFTARKLNGLYNRTGDFWEEGFFDHRCRKDDDIEDMMTYMEHNPVRAGVATTAGQWPFSSANPENAKLLDRDWYAEMR